MKLSNFFCMFVVVLAMASSIRAFTVANGWVVKQISNSANIPDCQPVWDGQPMYSTNLGISGTNIVWEQLDVNDIPQVMFWNGTTITQISNAITNGGIETPCISGSNVVWTQPDVNGITQVMCWNGTTTTQVSNAPANANGYAGVMPGKVGISGSNVVWMQFSDNNGTWQYSQFIWNGATTTQISNIATNTNFLCISGLNMAWLQQPQIMFWNGTTTTQIQNAYESTDLCISDSNLAWVQNDVNSIPQVRFWNGTTTTQISNATGTQIYGNGGYYDGTVGGVETPCISGSNVAWLQQNENNISQVMFWNGTATTQLSADLMNKGDIAISGTNVVWWEASDLEFLYYWNGQNAVKLVTMPALSGVFGEYSLEETAISGTNIAFLAYDDNGDIQVFLAQPANTSPVCSAPIPGDLNGDCKVDFKDFAIMAANWLACNLTPPSACWQ